MDRIVKNEHNLFKRKKDGIETKPEDSNGINQKDNSITPEEWAMAMCIGLATGVGFTMEAELEFRKEASNRKFKERFLQTFDLMVPKDDPELANLRKELGLDKEPFPSSWYLD